MVRPGVSSYDRRADSTGSPGGRTKFSDWTTRVFVTCLMKQILHKTWPGAHAGGWIDNAAGDEIVSYNPSDGSELGRIRVASEKEYDAVAQRAVHTFERWRMVPAPKRGEIVREIGNALRDAK